MSPKRWNWLNNNGLSHVRGAPYHPQSQGKLGVIYKTAIGRIE